MADTPKDKIKYGLLKFIDLSGFKVFDPPVRLAFGEDPKKQINEIGKFMILPIIFVSLCIFLWSAVAPTHKTKSGAAPTPTQVWGAWKDNSRFGERENEKLEDYELSGVARTSRIAEVKSRITELEADSIKLEAASTLAAKKGAAVTAKRIAPLTAQFDKLKAEIKTAKATRKATLEALAAKVAARQASSDSVLTLVQQQLDAAETEKEQRKILDDQVKKIRDDPPETIKEAQLAANKIADEIQHYKKRLSILNTSNKEVKKAALLAKVGADEAILAASTNPAEIISKSKSIVTNTKNAASVDEQKFAPTATIAWQTKRSLATVFVGFLIAAVVAIPVGIMCGLNKIVMACLTPIISIFRPVSPVVWLLIFQIVVGAFFLPDPAKHPLFTTLNQDYWFGWIKNPIAFLNTNPAMIFSASTVAMCSLWPALVNTALGVSAIDKDHLNVARVLKLGFWARLFKIVIPSSLPLVFAGLRISLGVGWMVLIAAEALSSSDGLGKFVWDEYQNGSSQSFANIILACFIVGIIGFFLDRVMIILQKLVSFDDGSATA